MTRRFPVRSLDELFFAHIVMTLEEYTDEELALLPKRFREQLLYSIPVVDVCRLEGTQFTSGIEMGSMWEHLYKDRIDRNFTATTSWREQFFTKISSTILGDNHPYDFKLEKMGRTVFIGPAYLEDFVNYLVAIKCDYGQLGSLWKNGKRRFVHGAKNRHQVTQVRGIVPPGKEYQVCQRGQLVPPRYKKFFSKGSCFLPDSAALELMRDKCHYYPKEVTLSIDTFSTFLFTAEHEKSSLNFLVHFFSKVLSLTIMCNGDIYSPETFKDSLSKLLGLMLHNSSTKLSILSIQGPTSCNVIDTISLLLESSRIGLLHEMVFSEYDSHLQNSSLPVVKLETHTGLDHTIY